MVRLIKWADAAAREVWAFLKFAGHLARPSSHLAYISRATVHYAYIPPGESVLQQAELHLLTAVRAEPDAFKPNMRLPHRSEIRSSGAIHLKAFFPEYDLMHVDDPRVWWESDHDTDDVEDDHLVHYAMEIPLKRLIELVHREGGKLKVQDAYRADGIHYPKSLHKEGRAIDLTCWAADFDWVFYEAPKGGGHHIHASVRADR